MRETLHIASNGRRWGSVVVATLFVLTACGSSSSRYLADRDEKVYLRVPNSWHDVTLSDSMQDRVEQATSDAKVLSKSIVSPQQGAVEQKDLDFESPFATMTVYEVTGVFNQRLSASLARGIAGIVAYDPLLPGDDNEGLSEVLDFDPAPTNAKVSGSRVVFRARATSTDDWQVTDNLSTFFDPATSRLYALEVLCSTACYEQSAGEIEKIVNSWRIG
jgi:hypothetical protein